jgi:hypothetical protein
LRKTTASGRTENLDIHVLIRQAIASPRDYTKKGPSALGQSLMMLRPWSGAARSTMLQGQRLAKYIVTSKPIRRSV